MNIPMISNQKAGDNSTNLQAGRDILVSNQNLIAMYSIEDVAKRLLVSVFGELPNIAKEQIEDNQKSYFQTLSEKLGEIIKQNEELERVINSPDFQYVSKAATISASRSSSVELHRNLSSLLIQRINNDEEDLKKIVYNEAILTINKLTNDQLKILTLCFLIKRTKVNGLASIIEFDQYLEQKIKPFIDFKNTPSEFEHIVYTSCASISIASLSLSAVLKENYPDIFKEEALEKLLINNETGSKLISVWKDTKIQNMNLTSVGIVIASTFYEQITGDKIDIDIWIN